MTHSSHGLPDPLDPIRLALPSKGELADGAVDLLKSAGFKVKRTSPRQYEAQIAGRPRFHVVFMRPTDIVTQVHEGRCHLGVTGGDLHAERAAQADQARIVLPDLGYGSCRLVVAVPESWVDVAHMIDLAELAHDFKTRGRAFRVSTKSPRLVRDHFHHWGIFSFQIVESDGALELHPSLGIADIIVDLTSSGTTLKDNRLKEIAEGTVLESSAVLIGHTPSLRTLLAEGDGGPLAHLLDAIEGAREAETCHHLEVVGGRPMVYGDADAEKVAAHLAARGASQIYRGEVRDEEGRIGWRVTARIAAGQVVACQRALFDLGASRIVALPTHFVFDRERPRAFDRLRAELLGSDAKPAPISTLPTAVPAPEPPAASPTGSA